MAEQGKQSGEKKVLKVLCNPNSDEKIAVVASNYHEFIKKCKEKLKHSEDSDFKVYTEDITLLDEEYFPFVASNSVVCLTAEKHLAFPPLVFEIRKGGNVYQIGERNTLVCINVTDKVMDFFKNVMDDIHNDEEIFTAEWTREENLLRSFTLGLKTKVTLEMQEHTDRLEKILLRYLGEDQFKVFRLITEKFFVRYKAMLTSLFTGCLHWRFSFTSEEERNKMTQDLPSVEMMLRSILLAPNWETKYPEMGQIGCTTEIVHEETQAIEEIRRGRFNQPRLEDNHRNNQSRSMSRNEQYSYKRGDDSFAKILKSLESRVLQDNSLESIYQTCMSFPGNHPVIQEDNILYTVLCLDRSKSLRKEEFSTVKECAIQYFEELDKSAQDPLHLDECVAILSFGDCLTNETGFSFDIHSQISLIGNMEQATERSGPAHVFEAVVAADLLLKKYGKRRNFRGTRGEYLRPRVVLITGSGAGEIIDDNATQLMQRLKDIDACYPVYCYNVQQSQNQRLLSFLTSQSNGKVIPEGRSALLGKFHKLKMNKIISPKSKNAEDMEDIDFLFG